MNNPSLKIGQLYLIDHDRKGKFYGILKFFDDTWMIFNTENEDNEIVVRRSFCRTTLAQ